MVSQQQASSPISDPIIVGSHVMLEGKDAVSSGTLAYIEGDILEIQINNSKAYALGEAVKLVLYSPDGILNMSTSIVARDTESIYMLTPEKLIQMYLKRRKQPRVDVREKIRLIKIDGVQPEASEEAEEPSLAATISNIALGGIGFVSLVPLKERLLVSFEWNLDGAFECKVRIVHSRQSANGHYYGSEFVDFPKGKLNLLRAYILRKQIENRQEQKKSPFDNDITSAI